MRVLVGSTTGLSSGFSQVRTVMTARTTNRQTAMRSRNARFGAKTLRRPYTIGLRTRPTTPHIAGALCATSPKTKTARIPGEMKPWNSWMYLKMPPKAGLSRRGDMMHPITTNTPTPRRPTSTSVFWLASLCRYSLKRSMVKMVEAAFSIEARELITAPRMAASMKPRRPVGIRCLIRRAKAESYLRPMRAVCTSTRSTAGEPLVPRRDGRQEGVVALDQGQVRARAGCRRRRR